MDDHEPSARAEAAAARLLDTLDDEQRGEAAAPFDDEGTRRDWHYVPRDRPGLCLAEMAPFQQKCALELLACGFSLPGYAAACAVMALEDPLDALEGGIGPRRYTGRRGWGRHRAEYHVVVFGDVGGGRWAWRFEGHHVSVTMTVVDGQVTTVPHFLGANPAEIGGLRVLPREEDLALALLDAMSAADRAQAIVGDRAPDDILTTNQPAIETLPPEEGVRLAALEPAAQRLASSLVAVYLGREPLDRPVDVGALRFAFAGEPRHRSPHYYRLQGADLLVEYDNTQNEANHLHTVVRRPGRDFGEDLLRGHRARDHGGPVTGVDGRHGGLGGGRGA